MRFVVRNLAAASYAANRYRSADVQRASWSALKGMEADVVIAQEATGLGSPLPLSEGWRASPHNAVERSAGSVVAVAPHVDADLDWRPAHPVLDAFGSYLDFARVRASAHVDLAVVSVHAPPHWYETHWLGDGPMPNTARPWPSDAILDALITAIPAQPLLLAGDWNEAINYPRDNDPGAAAFFGRARAAGLVEMVAAAFGGPVRTNFTRNVKRSYQNDHAFVREAVASRVSSVAVWMEPDRRLSDHAGIRFDLD